MLHKWVGELCDMKGWMKGLVGSLGISIAKRVYKGGMYRWLPSGLTVKMVDDCLKKK